MASSISTDNQIYFYVYPSAFQNPGGGEVLLLKTKEYIEKQGVEIKLFDLWNDRLKKNDLLHVFGSVKEAFGLMATAKAIGTKIVHSPIIWYNWSSSLGIEYALKERVLCLGRQAVKTFAPFIPSTRKKMMETADVVLAGSEMEAEQISRYFLVPEAKIKAVPYGADEYFAFAKPDTFIKKYGDKDFILCVGRIEPRKNQLNLIRAMNQIDKKLIVIGEPVSHHTVYYERCRKEAGPNIQFLGGLQQDSEELRSAFAACNVFVLPSWFETPGLSALEAGLAGAKIVITEEGCTREYFADMVHYLEPKSVSDIRTKIQNAIASRKTDRLKKHIREKYLWPNMAKRTIEIYNSLINSGVN